MVLVVLQFLYVIRLVLCSISVKTEGIFSFCSLNHRKSGEKILFSLRGGARED